MAETVIKTVEDVDKLFSQIVVNGETYDSDRYVPPQAPLVIPETPVENEVTESPETESPSEASSQGEDVHAVDLNNVLHNFVDPQEVNNRESADATLQSNIDNITALIPSDTTSSNKLVNETGLSDSIEDIVDTAVENAVANLDVPSVGGNGKYISAISETDGKISATAGTIDSSVTQGSNNPVTGGAIHSAIQTAVGNVEQEITDAIGALDVATTGGNGKYIASISETDGKISATEGTIDTAVTSGSNNPVTGGAVDTALQSAVSGLSQDISDAIRALDVAQSGGSGKYIASISETDGKISATEGTIDTTVTQGSNNPVTSDAVNSAIESAIASVYKPAGNKTCAELVSSLLVRANLGNVYNITDSGTTTSDFAEGAGKPIKAGDNVAIVDVGTSSNPSYKFDLLSGMIDLSDYIKKSQTQGLVKNDGTIDTTVYAKQSEMSVTPGTGANADKTTIQLKTGTSATVLTEHIPAGTATPQMDGVGNAGSSTNYSRADHVHPSDTTKQDKTLATALTIDGSVKTTVEDALSALNSAKLNSSSVTGTVESGNSNPVSSDAVNSALSNKVDKTTTVNGHALSSDVTLDKGDVGLGNVGNFKAVSTVASQGLTDTEKSNARANIGAGTSLFSGSYNDLTDKPTLGTASGKDSTDTVAQGSTDLVESGAVADAVQNVVDVESSLPTDAVLHYSFDEVPDYPDGTADYRPDFNSNNGGWITDNYCAFSRADGILKMQCTGNPDEWRAIQRFTGIANKIIMMKVKPNFDNAIFRLLSYDGSSYTNIFFQYIPKGEWTSIIGIVPSTHISNIRMNSDQSSDTTRYFEIKDFYIGDGSYSTPIIDNSNGQNNAVNNGGIAVQGVSGKGLLGLGKKNIVTNSTFPKPTDKSSITLSIWVKYTDSYNDTGSRNLFGIGSYNGAFCIFQYYNTSANSMRLSCFIRQDSSHARSYAVNVTRNVWHNAVLIWENKKPTFYVDGIKYTSSALDISDFTFGGNLWRIGDTGVVQGNEPSVIGNIEYYVDDAQIFDRALSETEVQALYQNKANTPKYYDLNDYRIENADTAPAENSTDLITSGAVYEAMQSSGSVKSVCSQNPDTNGNVELTKADIGLGNVANTGDSAVPASGGTDKFTTGGAFDFFGKSKSASSWLGKVFGRFMGRKWAQITGTTNTLYYTPVYANNLWVAGSIYKLYWSEDGKNWTQGTGASEQAFTPIYADDLWVAGTGSGLVWSTDGKAWTRGTGLLIVRMETPFYANGLWVAGSENKGLWWSEDGKSWTQVTGETASYNMHTPFYANGLWVAGSMSHGMWWSTDGKNWTQGTSPASRIESPVYANGLWVAGSKYGSQLQWSEDGKTWTLATGVSYGADTPIYVNGLWIAGNYDNAILGLWYSEDGKNWSQLPGATSSILMLTPIYKNGLFLAGSEEGLWYSEDGKNWAHSNNNISMDTPFYANGLWIAGSLSASSPYQGLWYSDTEMALEELTD